jgi:ABC-2 type transport system permease protein
MSLYYVVQFAIVGFTVMKFHDINGWKMQEIAFLYSFILVAQGINTMIFGPLVRFDEIIRKGEWDYLLVKPMHPLTTLLCMQFDPSAIIHFLLGIGFFFYAASSIGLALDFWTILLIIQVWFGGALVMAAIRIIIASIAFYAVSIESLVHFFVYSSREFILYPINIYKNPIPFVLTFIFPIAFVNFYPSQMFLQKEGLFYDGLKYLSFPVGLGMFALSLVIFRMGGKSYHSTGS